MHICINYAIIQQLHFTGFSYCSIPETVHTAYSSRGNTGLWSGDPPIYLLYISTWYSLSNWHFTLEIHRQTQFTASYRLIWASIACIYLPYTSMSIHVYSVQSPTQSISVILSYRAHNIILPISGLFKNYFVLIQVMLHLKAPNDTIPGLSLP